MKNDGVKRLALSPSAISSSQLLGALWRSPDRIHQIGALNRQTGQFRNIPVCDVGEAVRQALALSDAGSEAYFACAEYATPDSRVAANASGACAFWLDVDCGEEKAAAGKGYATVGDAEVAMRTFCKGAGLPEPTHLVASGGGLHLYWVLTEAVSPELWTAYARKLKRITKASGFLADDTRTADIASILRLPGTVNRKYVPPRLVTLLYAADTYSDNSAMIDAIDRAHAKLSSAAAAKGVQDAIDDHDLKIAGTGRTFKFNPAIIVKLASALFVLDPDCDDETWKLRRIAPLARAANQCPEMADALYVLARSWSSGELRKQESVAWVTPGGNGKTGEEIFDSVWQRFLIAEYAGVPITLATIFYEAKLAGWDPRSDPAEAFEIVDTKVVTA
jgi:hypothetical protein